MPISKDEVTKILELDLTGIPRSDRAKAKQDVLDFIKEQVLADIAEARSPVTGKAFRALSKDYKQLKQTESGAPIANMELTGAMLDAFDGRMKGNTVEVGWWIPEQAVKAYNHTTGDTVPQRQLLPGPDDDFRPAIMREVNNILDEYRAS